MTRGASDAVGVSDLPTTAEWTRAGLLRRMRRFEPTVRGRNPSLGH
ncbi:hypothetical protein ACFRH4_03645 [Streptomyces mirabilis]